MSNSRKVSPVDGADLTSRLLEDGPLEEGADGPLDGASKPAAAPPRVSLLGTARNTAAATVFLLLSEAVGTGIFSLPGAAQHLGWILAGVSLVLFSFAAYFSGILLIEVQLAHPQFKSYTDAAHALLGRRCGQITQLCIVVKWGAELVYYLITVADTVALVADDHPGVLDQTWQRTLIAAALIALPAQCRDYHAIAYLAVPSTAAIAVALGLILADLGSQGRPYGATTSVAPAAGGDVLSQFQSLANVIFAYESQSLFFQVMSEMRSFGTRTRVAAVTYPIMTGLYSVTIVVAYGYQGGDVASFLPAGMSKGPCKAATAALLAFHIVIAYVMNSQPFTHFLHSKIFPQTLDQQSHGATLHWALLSLSYLAICYAVANAVPFFADVQALIGALFGAPVVFGWPVLFYASACYRAAGRSRTAMLQKMGTWRVLLCGVFLFVCCPLFCVLGVIASARDLGAAVAKRAPPLS